jgi:16S rRNA (guanine527-N7)-methyltransferase
MAPQTGASQLRAALEASRAQGFLGAGPIDDHITHAEAFARHVDGHPSRVVDLGSGGGVPGLVLAALAWPSAEMVLLDGSTRRAAFLEDVVVDLDLAPRVRVDGRRAEVVGRDAAARGLADVIVSRSFGPPSVVAECAAPLLQVGGTLVVSEPPGGRPAGRWPADGLAELGLEVVDHVTGPPAFLVARQFRVCPERYPRRVGIPAKRPLFD